MQLPSLTALIVACARGLESGIDDVGPRLVPTPLAGPVAAVLRVASFGLSRHVVLRTLAIDAAVRSAAAPQLVVLGAGLDARAHRMPELADTTVFEIDHPATQAYKRRRIAELGVAVLARELRHVAVDFERDALDERLEASGHDQRRPTMWIWEGVTMYLTREAVRGTLATIAARSAPDSTLAMTYATADLASGSKALGPLRPFVTPAFAVIREPLRFLTTPSEIAEIVAEAFDGRTSHPNDNGSPDWAADAGRSPPRIVIAERLLVDRPTAHASRSETQG